MERSLVMNFLNEGGQKTSLRVSNVKEALTEAEVKTAMEAVVENNIFEYKGGDLKTIDSAHILENETVELNVK
ncbi:MAG: DUF2922 domain-containing protein [Clostridium sp.]|jgi:cellobiose-specific phosphotransferase system component IIB|uniref:DUF2922 domain-containing protein n=1 Tax=Clostridium sp. TaxID=1506 RepID=UPI0025C5BEFC|nr:DUF2922 domain-containing protein [Clostridium sp.]MCH3965990.1 DUF2922 domain-containing protein [Clostridium sp.]MCI1715922.1 DUF2922 domain-containing protein [Clostridium sp.]MCI1800406.1 DUF2922 domain-containing protein [Clostridium sp.]MCI1814099.1 DUF2922 domain-containing protein [Clostridium sp.]MCI1870997.1 DUF2922 domain-containing protein [Clostridium sp.]